MVDANVVGAINQLDPKMRDVENVKKYDKTNKRLVFVTKLRGIQQDYTIAHKPYDFRSAKKDYEFSQEDAWRRGKKGNATRVEEVDIPFDFEKYGDIKRFKLLETKPIYEDKLMDGMRTTITTGSYNMYVSVTGTRISVQIPLPEPEKKAEVKA